MKKNLITSVLMTIATTILLGVIYPLVVTGLAQLLFHHKANGQLISKSSADQTVRRSQVGGGWFVTPNVLAKLEYVNQKYVDFPVSDIRYGGQFKGFMISGAVGF